MVEVELLHARGHVQRGAGTDTKARSARLLNVHSSCMCSKVLAGIVVGISQLHDVGIELGHVCHLLLLVCFSFCVRPITMMPSSAMSRHGHANQQLGSIACSGNSPV